MKFSIIIPTYNRAGLLPKAINSIQQQSYGNWELIIVDDGSTDSTAEVVKPFISDTRIKYIYQQNAERSAARNNGIQNATGDYICFLDSDDYFLPDRLQLLSRAILTNNKIALYYTGALLESQTHIEKIPLYPYCSGNVYDHIIKYAISTQQVCMHRTITQQHLFNPAISIGEDMELWLRVATTHPLICLSDQYTVVIVNHENRSIGPTSNVALKAIDTLQHIKRYSPAMRHITTTAFNRRLSGYWFQSAAFLALNGHRIMAIVHLLKSLFLDLLSLQTKYRLHVLYRICTGYSTDKLYLLLYHVPLDTARAK